MLACGWNVIDIQDSNFDVKGIVQALVMVRNSKEKPTFINVRTIIGIGSQVAGDSKAHGAAFGAEDVAGIKRTFGMDDSQHFVISDKVYQFFRDAVPRGPRGNKVELELTQLIEEYSASYPELAAEFTFHCTGVFTDDWSKFIPVKGDFPTTPVSLSFSCILVFCREPLWSDCPRYSKAPNFSIRRELMILSPEKDNFNLMI